MNFGKGEPFHSKYTPFSLNRSRMGFFRSSFLFVYNIPSFVTEHMVSSNIRRLEYVKFMPQFYDNMRCGFALVEIDEARMSTADSQRVTSDVLERIRDKKFSGQTIEVDEVWFKSMGKDTDPPHQDLLKSNFIFVYNVPSNGFTQQELEELTQSNNVIFLPEIDDDTRCAFVEVPELSEADWDRMLDRVRSYYRRGCQFSVDEIWLNPVNDEQLGGPAEVPEPVPITARVPIVRDYQPPTPSLLGAPMPRAVPPVVPPAMPAIVPPVMTTPMPTPPAPNPSWPSTWSERQPHQPPPSFSWQQPQNTAVADQGTSDASTVASVQRILISRPLQGALSSLLDEEIRALGELVNRSMQRIQAEVQLLRPAALPTFFANVQSVHTEHCSRRNGHLPLSGMDPAGFQRAVLAATSKLELTCNAMPVPAVSKPDTRALEGSESAEEPPAKKLAAPAPERVVEQPGDAGNMYLFVNRIPKSLPLMQLLHGVPRVENFVFCESSDEQTKSGFAFLRSSSEPLLTDVVHAFRNNGMGIGVFRVRLEPLTTVKLETAFPDENPQTSVPSVGDVPVMSTSSQHSFFSSPSTEVPAPPKPPPSTLVQFSFGNGNSKKGDVEVVKEEKAVTVTPEDAKFMLDTGFNDEKAPIVYCVEVRGMPINTSESQFNKAVKDRIGRIHEYCLLTDSSNKSRRALFFGGSHEEATALQAKLKSLLQNVHHKLEFRVLLTNHPDTLAPLPQRLTTDIKSRRLLLCNLPDWPVELLLMRVGKFIPKAVAYIAPRAADQAGTSLGHMYLGYESHEEADADLYRLSEWKLTSNDSVTVKLAVDTGWGKDGPLTGDEVGGCRQLERILRYRREVGADKIKFFFTADALSKYKTGPPVASDLHSTLGRYIYEGALENLYAMVIRRLPINLDLDNFIRRVVKGKLFGLEASSMLSATGEHKEVVVFFGSRESAAVDNACSILRKLVATRNRDFMAVIQDSRASPEVERHLGDTFVPVTKDFAMRRGCQFLIFSNIPCDVEKTDCLYGLRSLCPNARSFYVPTGSSPSGADSGRVMGFAVARFNDPRQCRAAFLALSPTCTLAGSTIRVSFAALHKVLSTTYQDRSYSVPLHVWYSWLRYNPETSASDPWVLDNTSRYPFFCTCHHVVLPFKPTQFKGLAGSVWRKNK